MRQDKFVRIDGQIRNPGKYPFQGSMSLKDLINATMTLNDLEFMNTVDLSMVTINRKNPSGKDPLIISFNLNEKDFPLSNGDHITVPRRQRYYPIESVQITGEVKYPGIYPVNNLTTLAKVLELSGGYSDNGLKDGIEIFRDSLKIAWENKSIILNNGDSLNVLKKSGLILVDGEVNVPGYVNFRKGDSIKKYINKAGGFSAFAEARDVLIIYPNGIAKPNSRWFSPKVQEGSTIIVNQRALTSSKGPTGWEAFSLISSQAGNIATTLLTLILLMEQSRGSSGS